ncbi:VOC family protein [Knoellia locipacati]|uniref:Glyoxalase n=1 Tax=Knoellia locipacati TaxID=882824 RepID=A0A512T2B7_9MICO|nr:VOC family protein [Knoellia locipacati]GEQ14304.1 glyoxalase [Knoellia locipacati]
MFTDVRACAVGVSDTDAAIAFFTGRLGFEVRMDVPMGGTVRWVEVAPPGATTSVALLSAGGPGVGTDTGIRFAVTDATALHASLRESGVDVDELVVSDWAPPMFDFRDPDGNTYYASEAPA